MPGGRGRNTRGGSSRHPLPHQPQEEAPQHNDQIQEAEPMEIDDQIQDQNPSEDPAQSMQVDVDKMKKHLECPICLEPRKQTRMVKGCLHRFCKRCIDRALRTRNHKCPVCRAHIPSTRSLVTDTGSDIVVASLSPFLSDEKDNAETLTDEERSRYKQMEASYARILQRQMDAVKRFSSPSPPQRRGNDSRGRQRRINNTGIERLNDTEDGTDLGIELLSSDLLLAPTDSGLGFSDCEADTHGEAVVDREVPRQPTIETSNVPSWGRGGHRSQNRRDKGCSSRNDKVKGKGELEDDLDLLRLDTTNKNKGKMVEENPRGPTHFKVGEGNDDDDDAAAAAATADGHFNDDEVGMNVALISFDKLFLPQLEQSYISCPKTLSVKQLCQYVASKTGFPPKEVKLLLVPDPVFDNSESLPRINPSGGPLRLLENKTQLKNLRSDGILVLAYMRLIEPWKQTRMGKGRLRRFCKKCIDRALRTCNQECPVCRAHIPTPTPSNHPNPKKKLPNTTIKSSKQNPWRSTIKSKNRTPWILLNI